LIKKRYKNFSAAFFSSILGHETLDLYPESLEMVDPDPDSMNPDPQYCYGHWRIT
jgi:hypothetical protein